jgi:hypothetical protein
VLSPGRYPLVVDPIIGNVRLSKVLMDGGSSLNIIYAETLELLGVDRSEVRVDAAPFHGIAPGKRILPLERIDLPVCFGTPSNFRKETLTFEMVGFRGTYHAVLGRPCYAKFMVVPNYTYLKIKMLGPNEIITVGSTYCHVYECDVECVEYAEALAESEALITDLVRLSKEAPDAKRHAGNFEPAETGNSWDLRSCRQQPGESLREYIRRFSKQRTELPNVTDLDVIEAFLAGTTCRDLVSKLGRKTPTSASELMDVATKFASGQEAIEAIFRKDKQPQGEPKKDAPEASAQRGTKKKAKNKSQAKRDAADANLVVAAEHRNPRKPPGGADAFDKMLKEPCPYH